MSEFINTADVIGEDALVDSIIDRSITEYKDNRIQKVRAYAFNSCTALTEIDLPNCTSIGNNAFTKCTALTKVNIPKCTTVPIGAFDNCTALIKIDLPNCTQIVSGGFGYCSTLAEVNIPNCKAIGQMAFRECFALTKIDLWAAETFNAWVFMDCKSLTTFILRGTSAVPTAGSDIFSKTPIASGTGYIYVPRALVEDYKAATNWSAYADQFRALEDYTVDGTTTGALDETKI